MTPIFISRGMVIRWHRDLLDLLLSKFACGLNHTNPQTHPVSQNGDSLYLGTLQTWQPLILNILKPFCPYISLLTSDPRVKPWNLVVHTSNRLDLTHFCCVEHAYIVRATTSVMKIWDSRGTSVFLALI